LRFDSQDIILYNISATISGFSNSYYGSDTPFFTDKDLLTWLIGKTLQFFYYCKELHPSISIKSR